MRKAMIEKGKKGMSVRRQSSLLGVNRNRLIVKRRDLLEEYSELAREIDREHIERPCYGARKMAAHLRRKGEEKATRQRVGAMMKVMGLHTIYCRPRTSEPGGKGAQKRPYLLKGLKIERSNQVWSTDITYIPVGERGYCYLMAVIDWQSRAVLSYKVSTTMDSSFCKEGLLEAIERAGCVPEIFNTDQGAQFTSKEWLEDIESRGIKASMDGKGRWRDNVIVERLWRSVKYEGIYLHGLDTPREVEKFLGEWFKDYNHERIHESLGYQTPQEVYTKGLQTPERSVA